MRRIAIINQKGGVGKTTTAANLAAALARSGQRVLVIDMDPQANLSLYLGAEPVSGEPSSYSILCGGNSILEALVQTSTKGLALVPAHIDLSGADLELAAQIGRETILRDALDEFDAHQEALGEPYDFVLLDCPPSLGLLSINALTSAQEVMLVVQTEFFALQGLSKLVEIVQLIQKRMNPALEITTIVPCLYDSRLKLAREVLAELRRYFPGKVADPVRTNVRLAESPSYALTIFDYAPESNGATDYAALGSLVLGVTIDDVATSDLKETAIALKEADREAPSRRRRLVSEDEANVLEEQPTPTPLEAQPSQELDPETDPAPEHKPARDRDPVDVESPSASDLPSGDEPRETTEPVAIDETSVEEAEPIVEIQPREAHSSSFGEGVDAELATLNGESQRRSIEPESHTASSLASDSGAATALETEKDPAEVDPAALETTNDLTDPDPDDTPEAVATKHIACEPSSMDLDSVEPVSSETLSNEAVTAEDTEAPQPGSQDDPVTNDDETEPAPPRKPPLPVYGFGAYLGEDFDAFAHTQRTSGS